jgi:RNA polymerase sigma-70 factor (ECF subfamily)
MDHDQWLADRFEEHRGRLRAVAYRMLGSLADADDAVQETWLRLSRAGAGEVENLAGWLTTITARVCLNMLRSRRSRPEDGFGVHVPDPVVAGDGDSQPEEEALLADSVSQALLVVLDTLAPAERLAFVLHDMFDLPFEEIAPMVGRTPAAARQLASRARHRVRGADIPDADPDLARQQSVVDAFLAAARRGDFDALVAVLDPDVTLRIDAGPRRRARSMTVHGAEAVARQAMSGLATALKAFDLRPARVGGEAGVLVVRDGRPVTFMAFTIAGGRIAGIDAIADGHRLAMMAAGAAGDE